MRKNTKAKKQSIDEIFAANEKQRHELVDSMSKSLSWVRRAINIGWFVFFMVGYIVSKEAIAAIGAFITILSLQNDFDLGCNLQDSYLGAGLSEELNKEHKRLYKLKKLLNVMQIVCYAVWITFVIFKGIL